MSHQPFETWLLSSEPLSAEQDRALQEHLAVCQFCQQLSTAWSDVQNLIQMVPPVQPAGGFAARWQARLAGESFQALRKQQRRQSWWVLLAATGIASLLFTLLAVQVLAAYETPAQLFLVWLYRLVDLLSLANTLQELLVTLPGVLLTAIPPFWWAVFATLVGLLSLLWIVSLRQLMLPRRITL
jgi:hypothetical protein